MWTRRGFGLTVAATGLSIATTTRAQEPLTPEQRLHSEGRYLPLYLELKAKVEAGDIDAKGALSQYAAFLGDEQTALGLYERAPNPAVLRPDLEGAESRDAIEAIVEAARQTRIVILNEAHNISAHRSFVARVVRALRPLGFDWFAAEAFTPPQDGPTPSVSLYRDGMPFTRDFGWYTQDPVSPRPFVRRPGWVTASATMSSTGCKGHPTIPTPKPRLRCVNRRRQTI